MLVGIDHIQFSVDSLAAAERLLAAWGYRRRFSQPDHAALDGEGPGHALPGGGGLLFLTRGPHALELLRRTGGAARGAYLPVLGPAHLRQSRLLAGPAAGAGRPGWLPQLCTYGWVAPGEPEPLARLLLPTPDLQRSLRLWTALRARVAWSGPRGAQLSFPRALAAMPLQLWLVWVPGLGASRSQVDGPGCTQVALVSTALEADLRALARAGAHTAEPREMHVGGRRLICASLRGPAGELVELVQPAGLGGDRAAP